MPPHRTLVPVDQITAVIHVIRGHRVMLDMDLAVLYGVTTKRLNEQVKRNRSRFPIDFMFQLTRQEATNLKSQFATSSLAWGGRRKLPHAFTEHSAVMLASVLNSPLAVKASIQVVRAFVQLRGILAAHAELVRKLHALERKYDARFGAVFNAIRELMEPSAPEERKRIGFRASAPPEGQVRGTARGR
jgi:hypothetical protein